MHGLQCHPRHRPKIAAVILWYHLMHPLSFSPTWNARFCQWLSTATFFIPRLWIGSIAVHCTVPFSTVHSALYPFPKTKFALIDQFSEGNPTDLIYIFLGISPQYMVCITASSLSSLILERSLPFIPTKILNLSHILWRRPLAPLPISSLILILFFHFLLFLSLLLLLPPWPSRLKSHIPRTICSAALAWTGTVETKNRNQSDNFLFAHVPLSSWKVLAMSRSYVFVLNSQLKICRTICSAASRVKIRSWPREGRMR